ncbi:MULTISPECIES: class II fumarate hydratase [unclassified Prochlorococcus]|uniref:class II fumarate hydratase n=1 Tax=unclassified Prochlorococcus TaxID=2627481 RepID=UPI000533A5F3|nr:MULTISPECIES: class II fumarate hydratase [unclassified Prochlorococcus]KGG15794.1 Fumarate hydratase class II [Prochlorococcus sp. MIT 0603]
MTQLLRLETDSMGTIEVPKDSLWGAQTQRALIHFAIGDNKIPIKLIYALTKIKKCAAITNYGLGVITATDKDYIIQACEEIISGRHDNQFPLTVWQTGSGTQTNMNVNEVISNIAALVSGNDLGSHKPLHPNDHVNRSQSTNDVFPSAIHIATVQEILGNLIPELELLTNVFEEKISEWDQIVKTGRTHLQDAVPLTLGQEASAWKEQLLIASNRIKGSIKELFSLPLGGTAIGTGVNTPKNFDKEIVNEIAKLTGLPFQPAVNKFAIMASHDGLVNTMSQLKLLAVSLFKIVNDLRLLGSGPRAGLGELLLPANEPGSSIMPGKVNPTQCEAMAMVCTQIMALDTAVSMAGSGGHLQMNAYKPLIGFNILQSIELLTSACKRSRISMIENIQPNLNTIQRNLDQSLMLVTSLSPKIGYEKASEIAQYAHLQNVSLREASKHLGYVSEEEFNKLVDPRLMAGLN